MVWYGEYFTFDSAHWTGISFVMWSEKETGSESTLAEGVSPSAYEKYE